MTETLPAPDRPSQTKIVATLGPASDSLEMLRRLIRAGVDVFRLNMAHGSQQTHGETLARIREASAELGQPVGVLADLAGPKIRLLQLPEDRMTLDAGATVRFVRNAADDVSPQGIACLKTTYEPLVDELRVGDRVLLVDGTVSVQVTDKAADHAECVVVQPGEIRSRQGVNLPGVQLSVRALQAVDKDNAVWATRQGIDFLGLSFVRTVDEIEELKQLLEGVETDDDIQHVPHVIAKIEKPEALENIEAIVQAADGAMVARGDLGVEIDIAKVVVAQKHIIETCHRLRKPVICATQMLDSMQHSRRPTRAEVSDVSNAILDGADACMLSGESAIGEYPVQAVEMMHRIALATEPLCRSQQGRGLSRQGCEKWGEGCCGTQGVPRTSEIIAHAAGEVAEQLDAKVVVVSTRSGATALALAKDRRYVPTIGVSDNQAALRRMCLYWGVIPVPAAPAEDPAALLAFVKRLGKEHNVLKSGDAIVMLTGVGMSPECPLDVKHNSVVVHRVQ